MQSFCTHGRHNGRLLRSWSFMPQPRVAKGKPSLNFFTTQCFLYNIYSNPLRAGFSFRRFQTLILRLSPLIFCNLPPSRSRFARGQHPPFLRTTAVAMEHRTKGKDRCPYRPRVGRARSGTGHKERGGTMLRPLRRRWPWQPVWMIKPPAALASEFAAHPYQVMT